MADFTQSGHLPNNRAAGDHSDPYEDLPRQRRGVTPQMHGRYPDHDVLSQADHWDAATRAAVLDRVANVPPVRFFDPTEAKALEPFCDMVCDQDSEPRVRVLNYVDAKLHAGEHDGFQFADLPDDGEVWRLVARGLDEAAKDRGAESFATSPGDVQYMICHAFSQGELEGGTWERLNVSEAWSVVTRMILAAFYAHPWAWNEIGFGGPAYPRGYSRLGPGMHEQWEQPEAFERDPVGDVQRRGLD